MTAAYQTPNKTELAWGTDAPVGGAVTGIEVNVQSKYFVLVHVLY